MAPHFGLLGSGEFLPWSSEVDRWLLDRATHGDGHVLILPTASAPEGDEVFDKWANMGLDHFRELGIEATVCELKSREDAERDDLVAMLEPASVAYFSGGNPAYLAATLMDTPFWKELLRRLDDGLAYAGCSAGISCLGPQAPDSEQSMRHARQVWRPGLSLFPSTYLGPHWDALNDYMPGMREDIVRSVPPDMRLLAVDEDTAVVGDGSSWTVMGKGSAAVLEGGEWRSYRAGDSFEASLLT